MPGDVTIDVGTAIPWAVDHLLGLIGKDAATREVAERVGRHLRTTAEEAAFVQCVGMAKPIPLASIYQPIDLVPHEADASSRRIQIREVLSSSDDAILFGGPGDGKTTMLHWILCDLISSKSTLPLLFTLRRKQALQELFFVIDALSKHRGAKNLQKIPLLLLVDGYDEVPHETRREISDALLMFQGLRAGKFILSCRRHYEVLELKAPRWDLASFGIGAATRYVEGFALASGAAIEAKPLLDELTAHGLYTFAQHPLLLALVCILKTGPMPQLPRDTLGLLRRALDTLTFRWDEAKGINRESRIRLDGYERVACLMRVAFKLTDYRERESEVHKAVEEHLRLAQQTAVDVRQLLREIAQFYGIFVPSSEGDYWEFTHRTIHDFLAARFWVESGQFFPREIREWNARGAYATCLVPDATEGLRSMLATAPDLSVFTECLYNHPRFEPGAIASSVLAFFQSHRRDIRVEHSSGGVSAESERDFWDLAEDAFLEALVDEGVSGSSKVHDVLAVYGLAELHVRGKRPPQPLYEKVRAHFAGGDLFRVNAKRGIREWQRFGLEALRPLA